MATFILILMLLAGYHFFIQSLVIPLFRIKVEYRLNELKNELILLKIHNNHEISDHEFEWLRVFITKMKNNLPNLNYFELLFTSNERIQKIDNSGKTNEQNDNQYANHNVTALRQIFDETMKSSFNGFIINMTGLFIYLIVPLAISIVLLWLFTLAYNWLKPVLKKYDSEFKNLSLEELFKSIFTPPTLKSKMLALYQ